MYRALALCLAIRDRETISFLGDRPDFIAVNAAVNCLGDREAVNSLCDRKAVNALFVRPVRLSKHRKTDELAMLQ